MVHCNETRLNRLHVSDEFLAAIGDYLQKKKNGNKYISFLNKKRYTIKDTDSSYRMINHWSSQGLIDDARDENEKGWRKFSVVDLVWLHIIYELRKIGLSLDKIKKGYSSLSGKSWQMLECGVLFCMMRRGMCLVVFSDGYMEVVPHNAVATMKIVPREAEATNESIGFLKDPLFIVVSLNNCLEKVFPGRDYSPRLDTFSLTENEINLLHEIRCGDFDEIMVCMKNGDLFQIDAKKKHMGDDIGKLSEILNRVSYGNFVIKKENGKIQFIETTEKKRFNEL